EVAFTELTSDGHLRHPTFIRLVDAPEAGASEPGLRITHIDRVLYPDAGFTKGDLIDYYRAAAPLLLPHLVDRFVSLVRAPDGVGAKTFFQRHRFAGMPGSIEQTTDMGAYDRYISISSAEGLIAAAQFSVLELHPWGARRRTLDYPDRLVIDLDPDETLPFPKVRAAARLVRDILAAGALTSFPLITGGKGIHVVAPLDETADWSRVSGFAKTFASQLARAKPALFTAMQRKASRKGRIYIDWQRNRKSATAIAPWSPRARPGAPVACPVSWEELGRIESAAAYDLAKARRRITSLKRDPWHGFAACHQTVPDL
ncbi:MAG: non-homologous end-joining DNA ligase, partial [Alphaproteobacteria bacterium]|nr:non-homologous end-joining DNA ligase [Alphaproteobacteria bacterium]